ncbi:hypothetical protein Trco_003247 [Trichoderma cornu-damae]|uniref:Uncharacterized protein n=1 Tax=Trichoderma cornu-damae TaxID=654480 RepID=A0A9P8QRH2_9HYPO|nr:hypothetical protein Trco_003247 [Trichoderma cornu-damae]
MCSSWSMNGVAKNGTSWLHSPELVRGSVRSHANRRGLLVGLQQGVDVLERLVVSRLVNHRQDAADGLAHGLVGVVYVGQEVLQDGLLVAEVPAGVGHDEFEQLDLGRLLEGGVGGYVEAERFQFVHNLVRPARVLGVEDEVEAGEPVLQVLRRQVVREDLEHHRRGELPDSAPHLGRVVAGPAQQRADDLRRRPVLVLVVAVAVHLHGELLDVLQRGGRPAVVHQIEDVHEEVDVVHAKPICAGVSRLLLEVLEALREPLPGQDLANLVAHRSLGVVVAIEARRAGAERGEALAPDQPPGVVRVHHVLGLLGGRLERLQELPGKLGIALLHGDLYLVPKVNLLLQQVIAVVVIVHGPHVNGGEERGEGGEVVVPQPRVRVVRPGRDKVYKLLRGDCVEAKAHVGRKNGAPGRDLPVRALRQPRQLQPEGRLGRLHLCPPLQDELVAGAYRRGHVVLIRPDRVHQRRVDQDGPLKGLAELDQRVDGRGPEVLYGGLVDAGRLYVEAHGLGGKSPIPDQRPHERREEEGIHGPLDPVVVVLLDAPFEAVEEDGDNQGLAADEHLEGRVLRALRDAADVRVRGEARLREVEQQALVQLALLPGRRVVLHAEHLVRLRPLDEQGPRVHLPQAFNLEGGDVALVQPQMPLQRVGRPLDADVGDPRPVGSVQRGEAVDVVLLVLGEERVRPRQQLAELLAQVVDALVHRVARAEQVAGLVPVLGAQLLVLGHLRERVVVVVHHGIVLGLVLLVDMHVGIAALSGSLARRPPRIEHGGHAAGDQANLLHQARDLVGPLLVLALPTHGRVVAQQELQLLGSRPGLRGEELDGELDLRRRRLVPLDGEVSGRGGPAPVGDIEAPPENVRLVQGMVDGAPAFLLHVLRDPEQLVLVAEDLAADVHNGHGQHGDVPDQGSVSGQIIRTAGAIGGRVVQVDLVPDVDHEHGDEHLERLLRVDLAEGVEDPGHGIARLVDDVRRNKRGDLFQGDVEEGVDDAVLRRAPADLVGVGQVLEQREDFAQERDDELAKAGSGRPQDVGLVLVGELGAVVDLDVLPLALHAIHLALHPLHGQGRVVDVALPAGQRDDGDAVRHGLDEVQGVLRLVEVVCVDAGERQGQQRGDVAAVPLELGHDVGNHLQAVEAGRGPVDLDQALEAGVEALQRPREDQVGLEVGQALQGVVVALRDAGALGEEAHEGDLLERGHETLLQGVVDLSPLRNVQLRTPLAVPPGHKGVRQEHDQLAEHAGPRALVGGVEEGVDGLHQPFQARHDGVLALAAGGRQGAHNQPGHHVGDRILFLILFKVHAGPRQVVQGRVGRVGLADRDLGQPQDCGEDEVGLGLCEDAVLREGDVGAVAVVPRYARKQVDEGHVDDL